MAYIVSTRIGRCVDGGDSILEHARRLFEDFHSFAPPWMMRSQCRRTMPGVLVKLGELKGLIYSSDKAQCGRPRTFIHFMESKPMLASDPDGRQLYILGGNYRVTARGIEG